jgi:hypothetical protein
LLSQVLVHALARHSENTRQFRLRSMATELFACSGRQFVPQGRVRARPNRGAAGTPPAFLVSRARRFDRLLGGEHEQLDDRQKLLHACGQGRVHTGMEVRPICNVTY